MNPLEMLQKMMQEHLAHVQQNPEDEFKNWVQVGTLNDESKALKLAHKKCIAKTEEERDLLISKLECLAKTAEVSAREYWNKLYKIHSLPVDRQYVISPEGIIRMEPTGKKA